MQRLLNQVPINNIISLNRTSWRTERLKTPPFERRHPKLPRSNTHLLRQHPSQPFRCRHKEGDTSRCRDCYRSILRDVVMRMRAGTLTRANCAHKHKHRGVAVAIAVVSMYHRGIDALLKDMRQHPEDAKVRTSSDLNPKPQTVNPTP